MSDNVEVYLAFFKAKEGRLADKLISLVDGSKYSHVELVVRPKHRPSSYFKCYTSHMNDGGVRVKTMFLTPRIWDLVHVDVDLKYALEFFEYNKKGKYDYLGLFTTILNWWPHSKNSWFCSELVAAMLKLDHPERYGIKKLYRHVKHSNEIKTKPP